LRLCLRVNRKLLRAQAALIATLYVLFSTFGAVTHVHTLSPLLSSPDEPITATGRSAVDSAAFAPLSRCAYCEWQANNVSVALPIQSITAPVLVGYFAVPHHVTAATFDPPQSSSRAPPLVS